jgi:two-component system, chemotaxis family, chemotaxis protein CheY
VSTGFKIAEGHREQGMKLHVLVVDDSVVVRTLVCRTLKQTGLGEFDFTEANDGEEALVKYEANGPFDLILADWNMPKMNGIAFADRVRRSNKQIPIVMVTSETGLGKMMDAMDNAGVNAYISKPFTAEDMTIKLKPIIEELSGKKKKSGGLFGRLLGNR